jgi:hypothetical protein
VTSKCHRCNIEVTASAIVSGDNASSDKTDKKAHYCSACYGVGSCPVVEKALSFGGGSGGRRRR